MPLAHPVRNYVCLQILNSHVLKKKLCESVWNYTFKTNQPASQSDSQSVLGQINIMDEMQISDCPSSSKYENLQVYWEKTFLAQRLEKMRTQISVLRANHSVTDARVGRDQEQSVCPRPCGRSRDCWLAASHWANIYWRGCGRRGEGGMGVTARCQDFTMESCRRRRLLIIIKKLYFHSNYWCL